VEEYNEGQGTMVVNCGGQGPAWAVELLIMITSH
jgi:hypothetical protein